MTTLRLIRRVQGRRGSLLLYEHRLGLAEVVEVQEGRTQVLELHRHDRDMLPSLMAYADEVQRSVTGNVKRPRPKRSRARRLGGMLTVGKRKAGVGA